MAISKLDQDQLASFLGHDIRVYRSIYRLPVDVLEKAKVAKILLAANSSTIWKKSMKVRRWSKMQSRE